MKRLIVLLTSVLIVSAVMGQQKVSVKWELSDKENLGATEVIGDTDNLLTPNYLSGSNIAKTETMSASNAASGYTAVTYDPTFTQFFVTTRKTAKSSGHNIAVSLTPAEGHTLKVTSISFEAAKCGTDGGNFDVYLKNGSAAEQALATGVAPLRNRVGDDNPNGCSSHEYTISDVLVENGSLVLFLYIYNVNGTDDSNPKAIAFRNLIIEGVLDEPIYDVSHYATAATFKNSDGETVDIYDLVKGLKNGETASYKTLQYGDPSEFSLTLIDGYTYNVSYADKYATYTIMDGEGEEVFMFKVKFKVTNRQPKGEATPLKRGLISVNLAASGGSGNLVSWRSRKTDGPNYRFKLWRGTKSSQIAKVNNGNLISGKTNFIDTGGNASQYYKLEVYDGDGNLIETEVSDKTWDNQTLRIALADPPVDTRNGDTYSPHDAEICDMDGDGTYNIILKWAPDNYFKDAAGSGTTSNIFFDCYKMDGTFMWRIDMGPNFFASQHTVQFICWDFDGDGYGEFFTKTAPGTIDGEGNYVLLRDDDPTENLLSERGKQDHGSEYITVFDGITGGEISTIDYHTAYGDVTTSVWGDSKQNRSERYLAGIAWLDGEGKNPSPIHARGYYNGAFVGAYDFDGVDLTERWVSRNPEKGKGIYGEGAHWLLVGDADDDGKQEIVYGSGALDHDGSLLYRTGLGHGDALHQGDFITSRPGKEVFMVHEEKPYGYDLRDAKTGEFIQHVTAGGDTGRGLAAHFDHNQESSQFLYSASAAIFNCEDGKELAPSWALGSSGAGINNRVYWDGDLADEFFDKSIIAHWNSDGKYFDRYKVNGGNYLPGNLNDYSKYHPCILADILGDWREEIMTWEKGSDGKFYLLINSTSYPTDYIMPHLMDNLDYRAQVIAQNVCYNQPPHLPSDPIVDLTVVRQLTNIGMTEEFAKTHEDMGDYWDCFYTTYPVELPADIQAWAVDGLNLTADSVKAVKLAAGATIPANRGIIYNSKNATASFRPSIKSAVEVSGTYLKGAYCDSALVSAETYAYYKFMDGENGLGFYKVESDKAEGRTGFMRRVITSATPAKDCYMLGTAINPTYVSPIVDVIDNASFVTKAAVPVAYYLMDGRQTDNPVAGNTYIVRMSDGTTRKLMYK